MLSCVKETSAKSRPNTVFDLSCFPQNEIAQISAWPSTQGKLKGVAVMCEFAVRCSTSFSFLEINTFYSFYAFLAVSWKTTKYANTATACVSVHRWWPMRNDSSWQHFEKFMKAKLPPCSWNCKSLLMLYLAQLSNAEAKAFIFFWNIRHTCGRLHTHIHKDKSLKQSKACYLDSAYFSKIKLLLSQRRDSSALPCPRLSKEECGSKESWGRDKKKKVEK